MSYPQYIACWPKGSFRYVVKEYAPNAFVAKERVMRREGLSESEVQIVNSTHYTDHESDSGGGSSSNGGEGTSFSEIAVLGGILLGAWVLITFWPIILGLGVIALIYWIYTILKD